MITRRTLSLAAAGAALASAMPRAALAQSPAPAAAPAAAKPTLSLPPLGYAFGALEPHVDALTMEIHHDKHHAAYVNGANALLDKDPALASKSVVELLSNLGAVPEASRAGLRNNLGGHYNHTLFWELMAPGGAKEPAGDLKSAIDGAFGSLDKLKEMVNDAGLKRFGSGWAWLVLDKDKKLAILSTANQDTPLELGAKPILGVDVWEHAYYLKHQNRRADYLKAWWNVANWDKAAANFKAAQG
jgi:Fe-Mn family superoxide dismutase